jgi:DNA-binding XRE family transcriptional regulator
METRKVRDLLKEDLKDPHFKELYELDQQKLAVVKKIIDYRVKHHLTQAQFAQKIGMTQQYVSKIEGGDFSSVVALEQVLHAIGYAVKMTVVPLKGKHAQHPLELQVA